MCVLVDGRTDVCVCTLAHVECVLRMSVVVCENIFTYIMYLCIVLV